jgi:probable DNA metabolism protein
MYCHISPKNHVLPLLAEHFRDRMGDAAWVIHDKKYNQAAVYDGSEYIIADVPAGAAVRYSDGEARARDMWVAFFKAVAIKERSNPRCQRNHLPLWFRQSMTEFQMFGAE